MGSGKGLAVYMYKISNEGKLAKDFGLKDQMRRSAVSISSNIAEGEQLDSDKQSTRHLYIARGSAAELRSQSIIAHEIGYLTQNQLDYFESETDTINAMLTRLIKHRN